VHRHAQHRQRQRVVGGVAEEESTASASNETEPEDQLADTSTANMKRFTASAIHSTRRNRGSAVGGWGEQQEADMVVKRRTACPD
jgi:hypothetical protein